MRATTLKASAGALGALVAYYGGLADRRDDPARQRGPVDYYLDPDEPPGRWWGTGLPGLGVGGEVEASQLRAVLEGRHPATGVVLGRSFGDRSARGFDATFSAPKSVSVLWALSPDPWVRAEVLAAHDRAVDTALDWFEQHGAVTRRGTDGVDQVDTRGLAVAVFRQHTSRTIDPQLHSHALVVAKVQDPTGKWLSLDARFLKTQQRTIGWVYDAALRAELTGRLGVEWGSMMGGQAELVAVPAEVRDRFSQRSAQVTAARDRLIAEWSASHDGQDPDPRTIARLERAAVLASRPDKEHGIDAAALHRTWSGQARDLGLDLDSLRLDQLTIPRDGPDRGPPIGPPVASDAIAAEALRRVSEESSTWLPADVARHVATLLPPTIGTGPELTRAIDEITAEAVGRCVELAPDRPGSVRGDGRPVLEHVTDRRLTTDAVLRQELDLHEWALTHAGPVESSGGDRQADAAAAIAGDDPFVVIVGPAGTGKTHTVARGVADLVTHARPVIGLAPSGKAADVLRWEAGCPTDTLAGFLTRHDHAPSSPWPAGTTVILDEAGIAATQDLARLVGLAEQRYWRFVVVGDPAQLPPVGRGGMFAHWVDTVPHHDLDMPRRFLEPWEADASLALRRGERDVATTYQEHDRLHPVHPALLPERVAAEHARHVADGRSVAITTVSTTAAREINQAIQARTPHPEPDRHVELRDGTGAYVGDRIATRHNDRTLVTDHGELVRNRHTWTIADIDERGQLAIEHPDRGRTILPADYVADHVELGWAVTGYGNQGDTVDIGIAILESGASREHTYVALTRGREENHAVIPDPHGEIEPADYLAGVLDHTLDRNSALATRARLYEHAGIPLPEHYRAPELTQQIDRGIEIDFF